MENLTNMASADDEAGERLVGNEEINGRKTNREKNIEVKYMTPDSQNGDAKIDIENLKSAFAGMGKEELMKYANDPFWVKMRWFLFILFWLVWIAMLAGAIAIIVLAPKCSAPVPKEWWEQSPLYQIDVRTFKDGKEPQDGVGDLKGLESKLDYLKDLGVETIVLSNVLKSENILSTSNDNEIDSGNIINFKEIDDKIGTLEEFISLAEKMKEKGLHMLMSFIPNHSSDKHPWFLRSVKNETPYNDYYVWKKAVNYNSDDNKTPLPPNKWLSKTNGSAWEWNEDRKMFYLHQFDKSQPDFNFYNKDVVNHFKEVMEYWLSNGVSGFHLDQVQYLLEDKEWRDEPESSKPGFTHDVYEYYNHKYTSDLDGLSGILREWNKLSVNNTSGILSVKSMNPPPKNGTSTVTMSGNDDVRDSIVGQLFVRPQLLPDKLNATILKSVVNSTLAKSSWPTWEFSFSCQPDADCVKKEIVPGLQVVSLLLPGTPVTRSGSELGIIKSGIMPWDNTTNGGFSDAEPWFPVNTDYPERNVAAQTNDKYSQLNLYKKLIATRDSSAIKYGTTNLTVLESNVFTFTRIKSGNPGYLVAFNMNSNATSVDLTQLKSVPPNLSFVARSSQNVNGTLASDISSKTIDGTNVTVDGYAAVVLQFVPLEAK